MVCGVAEGAVSLRKHKKCEGYGLKEPKYGLASEGKSRWCAGCGRAEGAVRICGRGAPCNASTAAVHARALGTLTLILSEVIRG